MELEVIKKEKNLLEIKIKGERHSIPALLNAKLLNDKNVEFASYKLEHPLDKDSLMIIKTKTGNPKQALEKAINEVKAEAKEFKEKIEKTL